MSEDDLKQGRLQAQSGKRMALISLRAGCLTFLVATVALVVGLLLDTRLGVFPRWTLIFLIGSAPFTLLGVFLLVRRSLRRVAENRQEDADDVIGE